MYNARARSEFVDSLDYLIPPVKKRHQNAFSDVLYDDINVPDQSFPKGYHKNIFGDPVLSKTSGSDVQTSSSLILKKTTKQLIREQYSILNLSTGNRGGNLYIQNKPKQNICPKEEKPTIKVIVIPNVKETQTSKVFDKRCIYFNKVHTTVSDQDNKIKNQKVYVKIKGRKREKINELKISESAKLSNRNLYRKYGDICNARIIESKQIIDSLNMDRKKRKDNKKKIRTNTFCDGESPKNRFGGKLINSCTNDCKNHVTVMGEFGLTEDDRYVLNYAATVNERTCDDVTKIPLMKNYNFHQTSFQYRSTDCNVNNCETLKRYRQPNSDVQTDVRNSYYTRDASQNMRAASQSTQVNFNFPNQIEIKKFKNQTAQCNCDRPRTENSLNINGDKVLKECKSPLVIISVYPRHDKEANANDTVKIIQRQTSPERKELFNMKQSKIVQEKNKQLNPCGLYRNNKMDVNSPKPARSRSPSPTNKIRSKKSHETMNRKKNYVKKECCDETKLSKSYVINKFQEHASCNCNHSKFIEIPNSKQQQVKVKSSNTDEVKKALVNRFMRNVNAMDRVNKKSKIFQRKDDASKVTINIDGENERYDVLLKNSLYNTGVSVKKTRKMQQHPNVSSEEELNTKSLENFLMVSDDKLMNNYNNHVTSFTRPRDVLKIEPKASRLTIKDSIEIFRRHEQRSNISLKPHLSNDGNDFADTLFNSEIFAPVKHYRGDNCSISDPNERDREIRELLGIMRCQQLQDDEKKDRLVHKQAGCCHRKCSTGLNTGLSISKFFTCKCLKRKNKKADMLNITPQKDGIEKTDPSRRDASNVYKKSKITNSTEHKHGAPEGETSESPETTEEEDNSKVQIHSENKHSSHKTVSHNEKRITKATTKKSSKTGDMVPQHVILNRNVQIFLQVEQFHKERPVVLTRKQYEKVKKIIECTISKKLSIEKRKRYNSLKSCNVVSLGEVKVRPKLKLPMRIDREIQTDRSELKKQYDRNTNKCKAKNEMIEKFDKNVISTDVILSERPHMEQVFPRQVLSSMEIRYASVEFTSKKRVLISSSSTRFKHDFLPSFDERDTARNSNSIHTIFKGHKRSATPNLGTSAYSLYSNVTDFSNKSYNQPECAGDCKSKRPFLKRLISCLIMRATQTSNIKATPPQKQKMPSLNSSLDSYHISTSLGALEMTSSLYDTSVSFYSNHTTMPVNKIKRGFFSSVRGFLTSRRS